MHLHQVYSDAQVYLLLLEMCVCVCVFERLWVSAFTMPHCNAVLMAGK